MVFKSYVKVTLLDHIVLPNSWRRVEVALIEGATEHNEEVSMVIYNTHQPSSDTHPWKAPKRIWFCRHVLRHAFEQHNAHRNNVGFLFWRRR